MIESAHCDRQMRRLHRSEQMREADLLGTARVDFRLLDIAADPEHQNGRREADPEHGSPGDRFRHDGEEQGVKQRRRAPADGPACLHDPDRAAAVLIADHLSHQHRAGRPFAAEAKALQRAEGEQRVEVVGEAAEEGEERVPQDGDLQHPDAAIAIRQRAGEPTAERGYHQRHRGQYPGLGLGDVPQREQRRDHKAENHDIHRVERPAAEAGDHGAAFALIEIGKPSQHGAPPPPVVGVCHPSCSGSE